MNPIDQILSVFTGNVTVAATSELGKYKRWITGLAKTATTWAAYAAAGNTCRVVLRAPEGLVFCRAQAIGNCVVCRQSCCLDHAFVSPVANVCLGCVAAAQQRLLQSKQQQEQPRLTKAECLKRFHLTEDASPEEIARQYKTLVIKYHPDKARSEKTRLKNEILMRELNEAYEFLQAEKP